MMPTRTNEIEHEVRLRKAVRIATDEGWVVLDRALVCKPEQRPRIVAERVRNVTL